MTSSVRSSDSRVREGRGSYGRMSGSINHRASELLADLAGECIASSQHRPVDGSVLLAETAGDDQVGSAALPHP